MGHGCLPPDRPQPIGTDHDWDDALEGCRGIAVAVILGVLVWGFLALAFGAFL